MAAIGIDIGGCKYAYMPKSRLEFWTTKFEKNVHRDEAAHKELESANIRCLVVWECTINRARKKNGNPETLMNEIEKQLYRTFPDLAKDEHLFKEACSYIANGEIAMFSRWAANPSGYSAEQLSELYLGFANAIIMQVKKTL